jgi:hypothetical protein
MNGENLKIYYFLKIKRIACPMIFFEIYVHQLWGKQLSEPAAHGWGPRPHPQVEQQVLNFF